MLLEECDKYDAKIQLYTTIENIIKKDLYFISQHKQMNIAVNHL